MKTRNRPPREERPRTAAGVPAGSEVVPLGGGPTLEDDIRLLEHLERTGPMISPARMSRKQRYRYWWGRGEAAKQEFDHGARRRDGHAPWIDLFNRLVGQHGPDIA